VNIGLVGAGSAALRAHLPALTRAAEADAVAVVAVVDPDPSHRGEVERRCPGARGFTDVETLLDEAQPDLLVIASPPSTHLEAVRAAFEREVDVVCEKPLGVADGDVAVLEDLHARHPARVLVPVHQYRFAPAWEAIATETASATAAGRSVRLRVEVERPGTDPLSSGGWRAAGLREGGILGDHGVHYLALCWTLHQAPTLGATTLRGEPGHEAASVALAWPGGQADIAVSYSGSSRRNLVELAVEGGRALRWLDGDLVTLEAGAVVDTCATAALSDRQAVNDLYAPLYDEILAQRADPAWRGTRTDETLTVSGLLSEALTAVRS
jgi:predicted dehydrogenase